MIARRRYVFTILIALFTLSAPVSPGLRSEVAAGGLPKQISDRAFWQMIVDFSEPGGYFRSDNFLSNETAFQQVIPELRKRVPPDSAYVGVGPDQNFTYITALKPRMAFIIDIRRQNMLEHLMYKAIVETSDDRVDFLARLFSRARPAGVNRTAPPQLLFAAFSSSPPSEALFQKNLQAILNRLTKHHGFPLSSDDRHGIEYVYRAFFNGGMDIRYSYPRQFGGIWFPTYAELMTTTDQHGQNHSYMANEDNFRALREFQRNNLIVPLVGDFGGEKAIRAVGNYIREHGATVSVFYTSNVEQYLFQSDAWHQFFSNVATLPLHANSTFVRSYFNIGFRYPPANIGPDIESASLFDPIASLMNAYRSGQIHTYFDVIERSKEPAAR
jgi:hypothetical protein